MLSQVRPAPRSLSQALHAADQPTAPLQGRLVSHNLPAHALHDSPAKTPQQQQQQQQQQRHHHKQQQQCHQQLLPQQPQQHDDSRQLLSPSASVTVTAEHAQQESPDLPIWISSQQSQEASSAGAPVVSPSHVSQSEVSSSSGHVQSADCHMEAS